MQRKTKASITILLLSTVALAITISFLLINIASPLGKYIHVRLFCQDTKQLVPDGLAVHCVGPYGYDVTVITSGGKAIFGSGVADGTYTLYWYWGTEYKKEVTIDCSEITWQFDYYVPNPTITKTFLYKTEWGNHPPVVGLKVDLYEYDGPTGTLKATGYTNAYGTVVFDGQYVTVCKDYLLQYTWGGTVYTVPAKGEDPIHFSYTNGQLLDLSWEETNYLEPKSWWRQK